MGAKDATLTSRYNLSVWQQRAMLARLYLNHSAQLIKLYSWSCTSFCSPPHVYDVICRKLRFRPDLTVLSSKLSDQSIVSGFWHPLQFLLILVCLFHSKCSSSYHPLSLEQLEPRMFSVKIQLENLPGGPEDVLTPEKCITKMKNIVKKFNIFCPSFHKVKLVN